MTKDEATELVRFLFEGARKLDEAVILVERLSNKEEAQSLRKTLATAIGLVAGDAIVPIIELYPELDPFPPRKK